MEHVTTITIPSEGHPIRGVAYEKRDDALVLRVTTENSPIDASEVSIAGPETGARAAVSLQLFGRALARARSHHEARSIWTFLSKEDFKKTGSAPDPATIAHLLSMVTRHTRSQPVTILLYETDAGVYVAERGAKTGRIRSGPFTNFSEAEKITRDALKQNT